MDHYRKQESQLRAVFYDQQDNVLMQLKDYDENSLIARSSAVLEEFHNAHCDIEDCDTHCRILTLKRCSIE